MPPPEAWISSYHALWWTVPLSRANIAYTDHPQAATMPRDTSVSIEDEPCLAFFSAARWKGHAAHPATGTASSIRTHCHPRNR